LARDLHDGVGQLLTAAKMNLHALGEELNIQTQGQQLMLQNALGRGG
jgi:two-component system NarL family sensor kinase